MIFSSLLFIFRFFPVFFILYFLAPRRTKNFVLFLGSLVFYAWGEPVYVGLMLFSSVSDYCCGIFLERAQAAGRERRAKGFLITSLAINLALLGFFKYADFLIGAGNACFGVEIPLLGLPLPVGISFYTFQTMSYTIDVYRKKTPAQRNFISFGAYVTMFPQLIAGPIVQYKSVAKELEDRHVTAKGLWEGIRRFCLGLGKKVLLANQAGALYELIGSRMAGGLSVLAAWIGILCFAFQIYFDFGGYSDMAVGMGKMMGFSFPENFNYPYVARSVTDFWRRWHMSLSGWFREYVYIPLGGNRRGPGRQIFNILVVWMLTGIWHGASWNFLFWGLWFGFFLILEKMWLAKVLERLPRMAGVLFTWLVVLGGWVLFSCTDTEQLALWARALFGLGGAGLWDRGILYELTSNAGLFVLLALGATPLPAGLCRRIFWKKGASGEKTGWRSLCETLWTLFVFGLSVAFLVDDSYNPFLYFRF